MTAKRESRVTPAARTAFRITSAGLTGVATFGAVAATGWVAAVAAHDYDQSQAEKAAAAAATAKRAAHARAAWLAEHPVVRVVQHRRPHRTVVREVRSTAAAVSPGQGGTITRSPQPSSTGGTQTSSTSHSTGSSASTSTTHSTTSGTSTSHTTKPAPAAPPPPPPPPAPSSGS